MLVCRPFLEWVRMDDCHAIDYMNMRKKCKTCQIRNKEYRQEIVHDIQ